MVSLRQNTPLLDPELLTAVKVCRHPEAIQAGDVFVTWAQGALRDAAIARAITLGAQAVVCEEPKPAVPATIRLYVVNNARWAFALMSCAQFGLPSQAPLVGVTGTDGKTSLVHLTQHCLGRGAARVGSLGMVVGDRHHETGHTSPPSEVLHAFLADLDAECPGVAMEISSHAAHQYRFAGLPLRALAFTGLGRDHLDYHGTMRNYLDAKLMAADLLAPTGWLVVNADDAHSPDFIQRVGPGTAVVELGVRRGETLLRQRDGTWRLLFHGQMYDLPLSGPVGPYQAWNAAAAALLAHACGQDLGIAIERLASCPAVPGRMELLASEPFTFVDYACTPQAISRCLATLRELYPHRRLAAVFGCGGDRDRGKRPEMGAAALAADVVVITNDNPRSEDPWRIVDDITKGCAGQADGQLEVELDRGKAIVMARSMVGSDGVVAVMGKGHETYQIIGDEQRPWSDRDFVASLNTSAAPGRGGA